MTSKPGWVRRLLLTLPFGLFAPPGGAQTIYWTDIGTSKIQRLDLSGGSGVEDLVTAGQVFTPVSIALDLAGNKMYWTEATTADFMIGRANLDGSNVEYLIDKLVSPSGIALDVGAGKLYWTDIGAGKIQRSNLDGSNVEDILTLGVVYQPVEIALDTAGGKIYWTEGTLADFMIQRANLDGTNVELLVTHLMSPSGIALDVQGGKIYWTDIGAHRIQRADLDGSNVQNLVTTSVIEPVRIALDLAGRKMYWTEASPADFMILRANLDGSQVEFLIEGLSHPSGIALAVGDPGSTIIPVGQARSVGSFVIVPPCGADEFDNDAAAGFGPFNSTVESLLDCEAALGNALAFQESVILGASMSAMGRSFSEASATGPTVIHAIAGSSFSVNFQLPLAATFAFDGSLDVQAVGDFLPGISAQLRLALAVADPLVELSADADDAGSIQQVHHLGLLPPGVYNVQAQAQTVIDHMIPPDLLADVSYMLSLQVATGDSDQDADVDLFDFARFPDCLTGPAGGVPEPCRSYDFDFDDDVDWSDFGTFQVFFSGSSIAP